MNRFQSGRSLSPLRQVEAYWTALCESGDVPARARVDPRALGNILEYTFVLERIAPGMARFRLAGRHLSEIMAMEVRGMPLTALLIPAARVRMGAVLERVFDGPAVADLTLSGEGPRRRPPPEARMILLPLRSDRGDVSRALGVLVADGLPGGPSPCRFDLAAADLRPVGGPLPARSAPDAAATSGLAEAPRPFAGRPPHLRVVK